MEIIEEFCLSKSGKLDDCEDLILVGKNFALLLDGATSKKAQKINGVSCGRWAVDIIADSMRKADLSQPPHSVLAYLDAQLKEKLHTVDYEQPPSACVAYYNNLRREVVRYGDVSIMVNGVLYNRRTKIDDSMSTKRAALLEQAVAAGKSVQELLQNDIGREGILEDLKQMHLYANRVCEWGYPVINGHGIVNQFIDVIPIAPNSEIVLASDGYPVLKSSLAESEATLASAIKEDPLCMRIFKSTKAVMEGQVSFDDRSYLRFRI